MYKLNSKDFGNVSHLIKSQNELSVLSVIYGVMPGEIYVNNMNNPTVALIKTSECNLIAGNTNDAVFNSEVSQELDFWDQLTADSSEWIDIIPTIHKNPYVRKYIRKHYSLSIDDYIECNMDLKDGFVIEKVDFGLLRQSTYENSEKLLDWIENWGDDSVFQKYGTGYYILHDKSFRCGKTHYFSP